MRNMVEKFAGRFVLTLVGLAVLSLAAPAAAAPEVRAEWAEDALAGVTEYDECTAFEGEPQAKVLLSAERAVRDLKVLRLTFTEISEEGKVSFDVEDILRGRGGRDAALRPGPERRGRLPVDDGVLACRHPAGDCPPDDWLIKEERRTWCDLHVFLVHWRRLPPVGCSVLARWRGRLRG